MADPEGVHSNPPPCPLFLNILWNWNNLVSMRPNYFIFMGYLRKRRQNQQSEPLPLHTYEHFPEILDPPLFSAIYDNCCLCALSLMHFGSLLYCRWTQIILLGADWSGFIVFAYMINFWTFCMLGNFSCFFVVWWFFSKSIYMYLYLLTHSIWNIMPGINFFRKKIPSGIVPKCQTF